MQYEVHDGHLALFRTPEEKEALLGRLRRIEGQARGLQRMVEEDRHCLEEIQQLNALIAAAREVALRLVAGHLDASVAYAAKAQDGAAVIDVGINRVPARDPEAAAAGKTRLVGDVDYDSALGVAGWITPVPGGVGPMTIACLLQNTLTAARRLGGVG